MARGRPLPWLLALPLMAGGSFAAHRLGSLLGGPGGHAETGRELAERTASPAASPFTFPLGLLGALMAVALVVRAPALLRGRPTRGITPAAFFLLPPLAFAFQEASERVVHAESFPFHAPLEPRFLAGLALQLPFALAALLLARAFVRVARRIARTLGAASSLRLPDTAILWIPAGPAAPARVPALALGYAGRGPPARR